MITIITRMGDENMRVMLPHLIRGIRSEGQMVTWVSDPMHGNTIKAPCGIKTRPFDAITYYLIHYIKMLHAHTISHKFATTVHQPRACGLSNHSKGLRLSPF
ncbi:hypothetical protein SAY87_020594 [Trapa incisa]|uniref:Phospho-2-dehydro-3-deoxyheptonate aldolase n=1 Tax=Trapa incisa TaxID=236973 RepID=A0AAN7JR30_9MYRT|nr:hypothetical protein SAY87_020594 [Trapa incisa]